MMTKTKRIELLEQRVAELMGEVERLKAEMRTIPRWGEMPRVPQQPYVPTWTGPDTIGPYEVTSWQATTKDWLPKNTSETSWPHEPMFGINIKRAKEQIAKAWIR